MANLCVLQVSLQQDTYNDGYYGHICGGTIISGFHVMTAAHCILRFGHYLTVFAVWHVTCILKILPFLPFDKCAVSFACKETAMRSLYFLSLVLPCQSSQYVSCSGGRVQPVWERWQWAVHCGGTYHHPSQLEWSTWFRVKSACKSLALFQNCIA